MANLGTWRNRDTEINPQPIDETSTTQLLTLRTEIEAIDSGSNTLGTATFMYAQGVASTAVGDIVAIEDDGTTTRVVAGGIYKLLGIAMSANVANQYGWYMIIGTENANVATSFADNADCYLTATAGRIDDAIVNGDYIFGMKGAGAESSNLAKVELNRPNTTGGNDQSFTDGVTAGTVAASKAVVVDSNKDIGDFRNLDAVNIDLGSSGTAGTLDIFPTTANKGKLIISCDDQDADTNVTVKSGAMGQATVVQFSDPGVANSYLVQASADTDGSTLDATLAEVNRRCDASARIVNITTTPITVTATTHGEKIVTANKADGVVFTLPTASGTGNIYEFIVGTTITSNNFIIQVGSASETMTGKCNVAQDGGDTAVSFETASDTDTITGNGTTTGGIKGDRWYIIDIASNLFYVLGETSGTGTEATPFSAAVS
jgi:hypothetical protein